MADSGRAIFKTTESVRAAFAEHNYIADRALALTVMLGAELEKPILLEGEAGVGKTDVAKVLAGALDTPLIRLQCYEGLDAGTTIYEWNYSRQILQIRMAEQDAALKSALQTSIFSDEFLLSRPLLQAIRHPGPRPAVLLIDEIDRADEEFEAFLLEILSDFQVTVPEIGTLTAVQRPLVVLTSNRTRELNDALKRRCLYLWIDYPTPEKEREIVLRHVPDIEAGLAEQICAVMRTLRQVDFYKRPGVAETLDWARALLRLDARALEPDLLRDTAGCVLKYHDDIERLGAIGADKVLAGEVGDEGVAEQI
ncbi:MAG: MoxR family ATPase [Alphaproteobacteria bacterium]|jgi:MoxR-like ATPase|nr:MoxR family ATPase [Alphaproteobacteria bacterium]MDP6816585.1 MoxR family ATPase [Alphaproteobacteria bacterium]|tara:strand:- start:481 stop:1410 length:930 start_codon:yes stop_codon:yes gene_type:complete